MTKSNTMETLKILRPEVLTKAQKLRNKGASFDAISRMVSDESGVSVSREMVRKYFAPDKEAKEPEIT